jgi:hypothetical protein
MSSARAQFLADCRRLWDEKEDRGMVAVGVPGVSVMLMAGPLEIHVDGPWVSMRLSDAQMDDFEALTLDIQIASHHD